MEAVLSAKNTSLCFNKDDFMVNDFSVDKFVSNYRKCVSLETLQADLEVYNRILCSAMLHLIYKDYADFLNLSSNLVDLDKSIKVLCSPLEKLEVSINNDRKKLHETMEHSFDLLHSYQTAHKKKVLAHHALELLEGLAKLVTLNSVIMETDKENRNLLDLLERLALDFNLVKFHLEKASCLKTIQDKEGVVEEIAENLKNNLEKLFIESLSTNNKECLLRVLRIYSVISMEAEAEKIFAEMFVKPYMKYHVTVENILQHDLSFIYKKVLDFIAKSEPLLNATRGNETSSEIVPGFDFLVNSVFPVLVHCLDYINPVLIYAHGNPEQFHENYTCTMHFLTEFEHCCKVETSVKKLRSHEAYEKFINKFNLDVYFEIMFSEIAGKFEKSLLEGFLSPRYIKNGKRDTYLLFPCKVLSESVTMCYNEKVFLERLGHCFFRLHLKLISRFHKATCSFLESDDEIIMTPVNAAITIRDVEVLINEFTKLFEEKIICCFPRHIVEVAFEESLKQLESIIPIANSVMTNILIKQCCAPMRLITDIPRLFRKTNRGVPSKPSSYVALVFNHLNEFISETESILPEKSKKVCIEDVTSAIILQCVSFTRDVLTAIEKMEHSLKILKRARDKTSVGSSGLAEDDSKIRIQLLLDLNAVEERARELQLDVDNIKSFKELKDLMNSTEKILPQNF